MVLYNQLPIYRDSYMLLTEIYEVTGKFPRDFKYTLGQDMKRDCLDLFRHLYNANAFADKRAEHLNNFLASFELLKIELRLCVDMNVLSIKKLAHLSLIMDSIGKQATIWRKKSKNTVVNKQKSPKTTENQNIESKNEYKQINDRLFAYLFYRIPQIGLKSNSISFSALFP